MKKGCNNCAKKATCSILKMMMEQDAGFLNWFLELHKCSIYQPKPEFREVWYTINRPHSFVQEYKQQFTERMPETITQSFYELDMN